MISSPPLRRAAVAALAALAITWPGMLSTRAQAQSRDSFSRTSPSGSYLAARHAGGQRDAAAAASYYRAALRGDPRNNELLGRTFLAVLANGEVDEGVKLAERVLQVDKNDRIARLRLRASGKHSRPTYGECSHCGHSRTPQGWRKDHGSSTPSGGRAPSARPR